MSAHMWRAGLWLCGAVGFLLLLALNLSTVSSTFPSEARVASKLVTPTAIQVQPIASTDAVDRTAERLSALAASSRLAEEQAAEELARTERRAELEPRFNNMLRSADAALVDRDLAKSRKLMTQLAEVFPERRDVARRLAALDTYDRQVSASVAYEGSVRHVFFHSIIIYPELAFDETYKGADFRAWNITRVELDRILEVMHRDGWILIDTHDIFEELDDGEVIPKTLMLPPGKKPFILSVDDVSYYEYMDDKGFASRLELDDELNVATRITDPDGVESVTLDGEIIPILDQFVLDNPDFSHLGAKGVIALTGYEGVLGYDTHELGADDYDERVAAATAVADRMKETGWKFASHSYSHSQSFKSGRIPLSHFKADHNRWRSEVGPIVGDTDLYISPFGYDLKDGDRRYRWLIEQGGINAFFPVSGLDFTWFYGDNMVQERINFDGFEMTNAQKYLKPFFDVEDVWDVEGRRQPVPTTVPPDPAD